MTSRSILVDHQAPPRLRPRLAPAGLLLACGLALAAPDFSGMALAAPDPETADRERQALETRIAELEAAVAALRAELEALRRAAPPSASAVPTSAALEARIDVLAREIERLRIGEAAAPATSEPPAGFGPAASKVYQSRRGVSIGGYGEMLFQRFDGRADDGAPSGRTDSIDFLRGVLYFGSKFNDRFLFNSEVEFEHGIAGEGKTGEVELEFAYLDFMATDNFGIRGGLLLIPLGFTNELHEPPIFHGAQRPEVERFIIPTTWRENGLGVYGDAGPLNYRFYVVNGLRATRVTNRVGGFSPDQGIRGGRQNGARADAEDFAVTGRLDWSPAPGITLGASGFTGGSAQAQPGLDRARFSLWDAHGEFVWRGVRLRGLYARGLLSEAEAVSVLQDATPGAPVPAIGERMAGWYGEAAWDVLSLRRAASQQLHLFARREVLDTQKEIAPGTVADPAFDRSVWTYGLTYRPIPNIAVKLDVQDFDNAAGSAVDQVNFALGYLF